MQRHLNPTLAVFYTCFLIFVGTICVGFYFQTLPRAAVVFLFLTQTLTVFVMFTPLHDAVHYIASKNRFWNEMVIWGTWPIFINFPFLFRKIHLSHHARTNQGLADPDHFTSHPQLAGRWVKSFLLVFYYYVYSVRNYGRDWKEWAMMITSLASLSALTLAAFVGPYSFVILTLWFGPCMVGIGLLAFANTAWPHHPGEKSDRIQNTRILLVPAPLRWLMLNQNYHLVHHLKPNIPWYDYIQYWNENGDRLQAQGAKVSDFRIST